MFPFSYLTIIGLSYGILFVAVTIVRLLLDKVFKTHHFSFSVSAFHIFMLPFVVPPVMDAVLNETFLPVMLFIGFGVLGVAGETIFSYMWRIFFEKPLWQYTVLKCCNGYTSLLNFIPYGFGGYMYLWLSNLVNYNPTAADLANFWKLVAVAFIVSIMVLYALKLLRSRSKYITPKIMYGVSYGLFVAPYLFVVGWLSDQQNISNFLEAAIVFGLVAFVTEYIYGRVCKLFLSKQLWVYQHCDFDHGHLTPLAIIPFSVAGMWFLTVYTLIISISG